MTETKPYVHFFHNEINVENINSLIDVLHDKEKIELWFSTEGGQIPATYVLLSFLNSRHKDIEIVLTDSVSSAGTIIIAEFKGKIRIQDLTYCLFHVVDRQRYPLRKSDYINDDIIQKQDRQGNIILAEKIKNKGLLNEKQIKLFLRGRDVVVYHDTINKWKL